MEAVSNGREVVTKSSFTTIIYPSHAQFHNLLSFSTFGVEHLGWPLPCAGGTSKVWPSQTYAQEKRVCPDDGKSYTFAELKEAYASAWAAVSSLCCWATRAYGVRGSPEFAFLQLASFFRDCSKVDLNL